MLLNTFVRCFSYVTDLFFETLTNPYSLYTKETELKYKYLKLFLSAIFGELNSIKWFPKSKIKFFFQTIKIGVLLMGQLNFMGL